MPFTLSDILLRSASLNRVGQLMENTRQIQRKLAGWTARGEQQGSPATPSSPAEAPAERHPLVIDAVAREIASFEEELALDETPLKVPPRATPKPPGTRPASFKTDVFALEGATHPYRLYTPSGAAEAAPGMPLIVLLHGCTQTATDFALGTAMNQLAEREHCLVLYPEQRQSANQARCWNWYDPANQRRDRGEAHLIARLTQHIITRGLVDPSRIYIAGLSAGGAMAAVTAQLYPEIFCAVGVHSGLPCQSAHDVASAFSVMRTGSSGHSDASAGPGPALPTIVFHGTADRTVHPGNGERIAHDARASIEAAGIALGDAEIAIDSTSAREVRRTRFSDDSGRPWVEHWAVQSGPHAWSGGDASGSYTDPGGPSASAAMLKFFLKHQRLNA